MVMTALLADYEKKIKEGMSHQDILAYAQEVLTPDRRRPVGSLQSGVRSEWTRRSVLKALELMKQTNNTAADNIEREVKQASRGLINVEALVELVKVEVGEKLQPLVLKLNGLLDQAESRLLELDNLVPAARAKLSAELQAFSELVGENLPMPVQLPATPEEIGNELAQSTRLQPVASQPVTPPKRKVAVYGVNKKVRSYLEGKFAGTNIKLHCYLSEDYKSHRAMDTGEYEQVVVWTRYTSGTRVAALRRHYGGSIVHLATTDIKSVLDTICQVMDVPLAKALEMAMT